MEMLIRTRASKDKSSHPQLRYREIKEEDNWYRDVNPALMVSNEISGGNDNIVINYSYYIFKKTFRLLF